MITTKTIASKPSLSNLFLKLFAALVLLAANMATSNAQTEIPIDKKDSLALVDLYNSTNGDKWINNNGWLKEPVSKWYGIKSSNGRIISITLYKNNLSGTIPASIGNLTALTSLYLNKNNISGIIPETIGNLTNLKFLSLFANQLTGPIPYSIGKLVNLEGLKLSTNQLSGSIPTIVGGLNRLQILILNNNQLEGTLPESLFTLKYLAVLNLSHNNFDDTLSKNIDKLENLKSLRLNSNKFHGKIPSSISNLSSLTTVDLDSTQFSDDIPPSIREMTKRGTSNHRIMYLKPDSAEKSSLLAKIPSKFYVVIPIKKIGETKLAVSGGSNIAHNTYHWLKDGVPVVTIVGDSTFTPRQDGRYGVWVENLDDTMTIRTSRSAFKKGDSLTIESNTSHSYTTSHYAIPNSFAKKRDRGGMVFHHPDSFIEKGSSSDGVAGWDYALTGLGKVDTGVEIRYSIKPIDTASKSLEEKQKIMSDADNPITYKALLTQIVNKIADIKIPIDVKELEPAKVKQEFNADWGATVWVEPIGKFFRGFNHCYIVALHKNNVGEAYYFYMVQDKETFAPVLKQTLGSLKFK